MTGGTGRLRPQPSLLTELIERRKVVDRWSPRAAAVDAASPLGDVAKEPDDSVPVGPMFGYKLEFFATLTASLHPEVIGDTPAGYRVNFYITGGTVRGPNIDARVRAEGGDWMCIRPDGTGIVDINITYETSDGSLILDQAGGVFQLGEGGLERVKAGDFQGSPSFFATPRWLTDAPDWRWLNSQQGFGFGQVAMKEMLVHCDMYIPRIKARRGS